ncbi:hypothetical protein [Nostoc sp.]
MKLKSQQDEYYPYILHQATGSRAPGATRVARRCQSLMGETPKTALALQRTGLAAQAKPTSVG